jgi:hypothetical protein
MEAVQGLKLNRRKYKELKLKCRYQVYLSPSWDEYPDN